MKACWRASALDDVSAPRGVAAARRIARDITAPENSPADLLRRGRPGLSGTRELVAVAPFVIVCEVVGDTVHICRVWHAAQDRPR